MTVRVVTLPEPIVTWQDAQPHLRLDGDEEKAYVEGLIAAATAWIDGPAGWLGRSLGPQLLEWDASLVWGRVPLPFGPVLEVESIVTHAYSGAPVTVDPSAYHLHINGNLVISSGAAWVRDPDHRVRYWAGYGTRDPDDATKWISAVPAPVRQAILLIVGHWYANREEVLTGTGAVQVPMAAEALLSTFRVFA